jgi:surface antigen
MVMSGHRVGLITLLALVLSASVSTATALADPAPQQWQPSAADVARTLRPCPTSVGSATAALCWSMTEDTSAWMAQPADSPYPWGQCTYYVGVMRPDIWNDRAPPSVDPVDDWDAWTWAAHAQSEGLSVDGNPRPGDVIVYSRAAVGNDTGHVAMVDAVGGTDPSTGDLLVTTSEMNVEGLDDASQGQGDTATLLLPRSELVPGMVQFIHRPGAGYTAPVWSGSAQDAEAAAASSASQDPSLDVSLASDHIQTISESTAPVQATVTSLPAGTVVKQQSFAANHDVTLNLPTGTYKVCVAQAATEQWAAASACATAGWATAIPATRAQIRLGRLRVVGRRLTLPVVLGPAAALGRTGGQAPFVAHIRIRIRRPGGTRRHRGSRVQTLSVTTRLHAGRQVLSLPDGTGAVIRHAAVTLRVAGVSTSAVHIDAATASVRLG